MAKKKEIVGVAPESDPAKKEKKPRIPWTEEQKKALRTKILKLLLIVAIVGIFSGLMYWLFHSIGVVGGTAASREKALLDLVGEGNEFVLYLVFAAIFFFQAITLFVVPGNTTAFVALGENLLPNIWYVGVTLGITVMFTSSILYAMGRFGGTKLLYWVFEKEKIDSKMEWFARNGTKGIPFMFLIPFMPNDFMCMICGASKMRYWQFMLIVIVFRPIEIVLLLLQIAVIPGVLADLGAFNSIVIINLMLINAFLIWQYYRLLMKWFKKTFLKHQYKYELVKEDYIVEKEIKI